MYCILQDFASANTESTAELLVEFFRYFVWRFDSRKHVVSVRSNGGGVDRVVSKLDKAEADAWSQHDRLRSVVCL